MRGQMMGIGHKAVLERMTRRYGLDDPTALERVLRPQLIPLVMLDKTVFKAKGGGPFRGTFAVGITDDIRGLLQPGRTGKFVPGAHFAGGLWREIAKGRILEVDHSKGVATGEVYLGSSPKSELITALDALSLDD